VPIPLEAHTWDQERLLQEIAIRLPKGWGIEFGQDSSSFLWCVVLLDDTKTSVWESEEAAPNLVLLNALGWLDLRATPPKTASPWAPRVRDIDARTLHEAAFKLRSEDPPDLDPKEIDSVYSRHPHKR
jgi:hypothetical protein